MRSPPRILLALATFPVGWAVRETAGGAAGGAVVLALVAACAAGLAPGRAAGVLAAGLACFVLVHLIAAATAIHVGLGIGAVAFAAVGWRLWRDDSSSSARRATRAS